jgi:hypothetical protein
MFTVFQIKLALELQYLYCMPVAEDLKKEMRVEDRTNPYKDQQQGC